MEIFVVKMPNGALAPASPDSQEALEQFRDGQELRVRITRTRNLAFHRKWFALVHFAYDYWEPPELQEDPEKRWQKKVRPQRNFDRFRKDLTILAGFYESFIRLDGSIRIEAKSIAFASMDEDEFEKLYSATIDVILEHVTPQYSEEEVRSVVEQILSFT